MKIPPVEAELFHADRRTDMTKVIVAFRNFANAPKNENTTGLIFYNASGVLFLPVCNLLWTLNILANAVAVIV